MKKLKIWQKVVFIIFTIIVVLRIGFVAFRGEVDREYITSANYDLTEADWVSCDGASQIFTSDYTRLNSLELYFCNISEDKTGFITLQIHSGKELIYQTNITLANVNNYKWKRIYVNAELKEDQRYQLSFVPSEDITQIPSLAVVKNNSEANEIVSSSSDGTIIDGQYAINYGYLREPGIIDRVVMISLWIILWGVVTGILVKFYDLQNCLLKFVQFLQKQVSTQALLTILEIFGCFIIIYSSGIEFQAPTKAILYLISLIATINYSKKMDFINKFAEKPCAKVCLILTYLYAGFALVGQRILIYPLTLKVTFAGLFVYTCTTLWFVQVINSLLYYLENLREQLFTTQNKLKKWQAIVIYLCLLVLPAAYNLFANNPGISSPDTVACMIGQAKSLHGSEDWHPAFYCMVLRAIETVWDSTYAVILVQYFFWAYVCIELLLYLRKKGLHETILIVIATFLGFNAGNYIHLNTIRKDIPYTLSIFWSIVILAKLLIDYEEYKGKWCIYLELIASLVGTFLYRKNGVVSFIIIIAALVIVLRKNVKVWGSVAISLALIGLIKGPVYTYLDIQPVESGMYIGLSQDILGVYYGGGEVSEDTLQMINVMTGYNNAEYAYTPTWSNQSHALAVDAKEFIINYVDTFIKNPILMTRAIIDREDAVWDIYRGADSVLGCVNSTATMDGQHGWNDYYTPRRYVSLYTAASAASAFTASSQWISAIEWRCGLFTLIAVVSILFMFVITKKRKYILLLAPSVGHIMSLLLSTGWSDFRYFWPLNLLNLALVFIVLVITKKKSELVESA